MKTDQTTLDSFQSAIASVLEPELVLIAIETDISIAGKIRNWTFHNQDMAYTEDWIAAILVNRGKARYIKESD